MISELLHSFFFFMPAVGAMNASFRMQNPVSRLVLFWGGLGFAVLIGLVSLGLLACEGVVLTGFSACAGGAAVDGAFAALQPVLTGAVYAYILAGPPIVGLAFLLDWLTHRRTIA